jgi:hypothetical protein
MYIGNGLPVIHLDILKGKLGCRMDIAREVKGPMHRQFRPNRTDSLDKHSEDAHVHNDIGDEIIDGKDGLGPRRARLLSRSLGELTLPIGLFEPRHCDDIGIILRPAFNRQDPTTCTEDDFPSKNSGRMRRLWNHLGLRL